MNTRIERINGKFECFKCGLQFNRGNHLGTHWKKCEVEKISKCMPQTYENVD